MKRKKTMISLLAGVCIASFACGQGARPVEDSIDQSITSPQPAADNKGFAVVELFTSEGCSSCPPADRLIEKVQQENAGKPVYVLAFHVDYWDHQDWKDRFSAPEFTERQRRYADQLRLETIYTPQAVVNGAREFVGSNASAMTKAIARELDQATMNRLTLTGHLEGSDLKVEYQVTGNTAHSELIFALVQKKAASNVAAGENAGRNLSHVQIVRQLVYADIKGTHTTINNFNKEDHELIGLVQRKKDGHITAAAKINL